MRAIWVVLGVTVLAGLGLSVLSGRAYACGGLFCNRTQPVNQAAERIIFAENGDGTVTAVIEIKYEGPSNSFSWVLPVPGKPDVAVSSTLAFDRLQARTNPQYMLQTSFADGCGGGNLARSSSKGVPGLDQGGGAEHNVSVVESGTVGPYDYQVISLKPGLADAADVAVQWLTDNGYDVTDLGPDVLRPYLEDNLNLLAFRLNKQSSTGSIRPVVIKYESKLPFIPIRPTAVAANDNMGVMVFVVGKSRAIPDNYKALELNEALINWFNPMSNYNDVVSAAADEAGGQGFATEFADQSSTLQGVVLQDFERQQWNTLLNAKYASAADFINQARGSFAGWDGFNDALTDAVIPPPGVTIKDIVNCPVCYAKDVGFAFDEAAFRKALNEKVYKPVTDTEDLLGSRPYVTRLYTTMSADEMTMDPGFNFNADLGNVSNIHTAQQKIECDNSWTVTLPQGDVVANAEAMVWPGKIGGEQPAARKILKLTTQGQGSVMLDNSHKITKLLVAAAAKHGITVQPGADGGAPVVLQGGSGGGCMATRGCVESNASAGNLALGLLAFAWLVRRRRQA